MTMILAYANTEYIVMAADRRVTIGEIVSDDKRTKVVNWQNRLLFGFTGIAEIGKNCVHTMAWLSEFLNKDNNFDSAILASALSEVIRETPFDKKYKRLTVLSVGYDDSGEIIYCLVSNTHSDDGELIYEARDNFWVSVVKPHVRSTIRTVGWPMPANVGKNLLDRLKKTHNGNIPPEKTVINILVGAIQKSSGKYISKTCLITSLQKNGGASFSVISPKMKPGQLTDIASPYFVAKGTIIVMPNQQLRLAKTNKNQNLKVS